MATASPERLSLAGKFANVKRHYPDQDTSEIERDLAALKIADYIKAVVNSAPPLTDEHRERISRLLWESNDA